MLCLAFIQDRARSEIYDALGIFSPSDLGKIIAIPVIARFNVFLKAVKLK